jgi:hypothetical protein
VTVGGMTKMNVMMGALAPRLTDYYMERKLFDAQKKDYASGRPDALYETRFRRGGGGNSAALSLTTAESR